ncbi:MAG: response regulator [Sedimenticola sp.]|nr:response regulator [Sedimenticola sp.]
MMDPAILQARLREVHASFERQLPERAEQIAGYWAQLKRERHSREAVEGLYRMAHNLAGAGGTFGYEAISVMARQVADPLRSLVANHNRPPGEAEIQALASACESLVGLCRNPAGSERIPEISGVPGDDRSAAGLGKRRPVYLLGEGGPLHALAADLRNEGADARHVADIGGLREGPAGPLVVDMACLLSGLLEPLLLRLSPRPPLVVLSESGDYQARLAAVRAGADAFLVAPVDCATLNQRLRLLEDPLDDPFRVLIVDDDHAQARYAALVLEQPGIHTRLLHEPQQLIGQLQAFSPHLILLDLYMPGCSGTELARMIRQYDPLASVSILFLSVERDRATRLASLQAGADDFITKPIAPDDLRALVRYRLGRAWTQRLLTVT